MYVYCVYIYIHIYFYLFVHTCVAVYMDICCVSVIVQVSRGFLALPPDTKRHRVDDHTGMYIDALYLVCMNRYNISHYVYRQNTLSVWTDACSFHLYMYICIYYHIFWFKYDFCIAMFNQDIHTEIHPRLDQYMSTLGTSRRTQDSIVPLIFLCSCICCVSFFNGVVSNQPHIFFKNLLWCPED